MSITPGMGIDDDATLLQPPVRSGQRLEDSLVGNEPGRKPSASSHVAVVARDEELALRRPPDLLHLLGSGPGVEAGRLPNRDSLVLDESQLRLPSVEEIGRDASQSLDTDRVKLECLEFTR